MVASGLGPHEPVYTVEKVIRRKGEAVICPRDGRLGAAYVDVVTGDPILPDHGRFAHFSTESNYFLLLFIWSFLREGHVSTKRIQKTTFPICAVGPTTSA